MEYFLMFVIHAVVYIGVAVTTLYINDYSTPLAIVFCILYLVVVNTLAKELNQ